ncbi:MAG: HutD family protein [Clostridiales bacterium]|nr:HutD family protein [Clostridiales bacterium]
MDYKVLKNEDFNISNWTGGKTRQLSIYPADGSYLDRTFVWRLSSATCDLEESNFSKLPDYDRVLVVLKGQVVLAHEDVRAARLSELEQDRFSGAYKTKSFGKITDYNLMVRKGNEGFLDVIDLTEEVMTPEVESYPAFQLATQAFFVRDGYATVTINGKTVMVQEDQQLVINYDQRETVKVSIMGQGHVVRSQIFYDYQEGEFGPTKVEAEKASASDFSQCVFIANTQFRFSKFISRKLKKVWYDEELQAAIDKVNHTYITEIVFFIGAAVLATAGFERFSSLGWIVAFAAWIIAFSCFVSPFIFMMFLPKPIAGHIKDINKLTPYEQKVRERQMGTNERIDKIIGRYKFTGTDEYDEQGNRIDDYHKNKF